MPIILPGDRRDHADDPLLEFLREKRPRGHLETALCLADWLTHATGQPWVSAVEVQALSRRSGVSALVTRLRCASEAMRAAMRGGLLLPSETDVRGDDALADPAPRLPARAVRYQVTALGHAVVTALPNRVLVRSVRRIRRGVRRPDPVP